MIPMRELADSIRARGILRINGQIRRGKPVFTDSPIGYGWAWNDLAASFGATVGDLMFNDAFARANVSVDGVPDTTPRQPAQYRNFLEALDAALRERGVYPFLSWDWERTVRDSGLTTLFEFHSPPLSEILPHFTKPSQNQIGEILLKTLGLARAGVGTADSGAKVVGRRLAEWGIDSSGFVVHDGSGLSRQDYLSPETLVRVLDAARRDTVTFHVFYDALPIAGVDGTLETRLRGTAAQGNAHAKTGSMDRVRSLTGYVTTADGRLLIFSMMTNGWTVPGLEVEGALDSIVVRLARSHIGS
jgi:D-alanyl-D-alanine carboxypeptidase/D-alanyl-D-alanine-endopeptidase (penicillin-binding protein 4)